MPLAVIRRLPFAETVAAQKVQLSSNIETLISTGGEHPVLETVASYLVGQVQTPVAL
jgi:hypothetical protein